MNIAYIIKDKTLSNIADAIREMDQTVEEILVDDYPERIKNLKPSTEDYMRISDHLKYPEPIDETNYNSKDIEETERLIKFYIEMEAGEDG